MPRREFRECPSCGSRRLKVTSRKLVDAERDVELVDAESDVERVILHFGSSPTQPGVMGALQSVKMEDLSEPNEYGVS